MSVCTIYTLYTYTVYIHRIHVGELDPYVDFEYTNGSFVCTDQQLKDFQTNLENRILKANKKKHLKAKKEVRHYIRYTVYCILYTLYSILYTVYSIQYTVYSI